MKSQHLGWDLIRQAGKEPKFMKNARNPQESRRQKAQEVLAILNRLYPDARCSLNYKTPFQLLVATVLSAQCTDERVNKVTPAFFERYPSPFAVAHAPVEDLETCIHSTGLYRAKAQSLKKACQILVENHGGDIPSTLEALVQLPGVGRKTANVLLGNAFGVPALPIDTHAARVSRRLGLTDHQEAAKIERDLCGLFLQDTWVRLSHQLIQHGRQVCRSRNPLCESCELKGVCDFYRHRLQT